MSEAYTIEQALSDYQGSDGEPLTYTELQILLAELTELRRKAALTDRLADEVLRHRARQIWNSSYSATSETAEKRARAGMVEEGLLP